MGIPVIMAGDAMLSIYLAYKDRSPSVSVTQVGGCWYLILRSKTAESWFEGVVVGEFERCGGRENEDGSSDLYLR